MFQKFAVCKLLVIRGKCANCKNAGKAEKDFE